MSAKIVTKESEQTKSSKLEETKIEEIQKEIIVKEETKLDYIEIIRKCLIEHIKEHGKEPKRYYITYEDLIKKCHLPFENINRNPQYRTKLGKLLAEIAKQDIEGGKPPITAIIYGKNLYRPRNGFYETLINLKYEGTEGKTTKQLYLNKEWRRSLEKSILNRYRKEMF